MEIELGRVVLAVVVALGMAAAYTAFVIGVTFLYTWPSRKESNETNDSSNDTK